MLIASYGIIVMFDEIQFLAIIIKIICLLFVFIISSFLLLEKKDLQKIML